MRLVERYKREKSNVYTSALDVLKQQKNPTVNTIVMQVCIKYQFHYILF